MQGLDLEPYEIAADGSFLERSDYERIAIKPTPRRPQLLRLRPRPGVARPGASGPGYASEGTPEKAGDMLEYVLEKYRRRSANADRQLDAGRTLLRLSVITPTL